MFQNKRIKPRKIFLISFILVLLVIQIIPLPPSKGGFPIDKIYHFITAGLLVLAFYFARYSLLKTFLFATSLEGLGEAIQIPLSWRNASFYDFLVELFAIAITIILIKSALRKRQSYKIER